MQLKNHILYLLQNWRARKDEVQWVLGLIFKTEGSCYRKAGSIMLINSLGEQFGLLSGGCLESDIRRNSRKVMADLQPRCYTYDDSDEDDIAFKLGVGCGGVVHLALLPINSDNHYLQLPLILQHMEKGEACVWQQQIPITEQAKRAGIDNCNHEQAVNNVSYRKITAPRLHSSVITKKDRGYNTVNTERTSLTQEPIQTLLHDQKVTGAANLFLHVPIKPPHHILIVGGGLDAFYVARLATQTGWRVSIWDPRPAQARVQDFPFVDHVIQSTATESLKQHSIDHRVDAAIFMSHSKTIDSQALQQVHNLPLQYLGLLGPSHRKNEIVKLAGLTEQQINPPLAGPIGLDIGGDLPESIAIAIIAECHAVLYKKSAKPLTLNLTE